MLLEITLCNLKLKACMNSSVTATDRVFAALAYAMPLSSIAPAGSIFLNTYDTGLLSALITPIFAFLSPLLALDRGIGGFLIFIALFAFVVRNPNISRFIRFNVLQAIMVSFVASVLLILITLPQVSSPALALPILSVVFLVGFIITIYGVIQSLLGRYADIPTISDAINMQMPY